MSPKNQEIISIGELAELLGVGRRAVEKAIQSGKLEAAVIQKATTSPIRKKYLLKKDLAMELYTAQKKITSKVVSEPEAEIKVSTRDGLEEEADPENPEEIEESNPVYSECRARREMYASKIAKLEYQEKIKKLLDARTVKTMLHKASREIRNNLLAIPSRIASQVIGLEDVKEVEMLIQNEMVRALEDLEKIEIS